MIEGVYHSVSSKHLQGYLDEYAFQYNHRNDPRGMFSAFVNRIEKGNPGELPDSFFQVAEEVLALVVQLVEGSITFT